MNIRFKRSPIVGCLLFLTSIAIFFVPSISMAVQGSYNTIGSIASSLTWQFAGIARGITGACYLAGFGFTVGAIMKFKQHRDNPTQIPVGTPIALLFIAAALMGLPTLYRATGATVFGSAGTASGLTGTTF